jgi:hypothetical protein
MILTALAYAVDFKVKLNLYERLITMGLLPQTGSFATLKIITELNLMLAPTDEENKTAGLETQTNGSIIAKNGWLAVPEKEIILGEIAYGIITDALKKLDEEKKLSMEHIKVYEKFMVNKTEGE